MSFVKAKLPRCGMHLPPKQAEGLCVPSESTGGDKEIPGGKLTGSPSFDHSGSTRGCLWKSFSRENQLCTLSPCDRLKLAQAYTMIKRDVAGGPGIKGQF